MDSFNPTTKTQAALTSALQAATAAGNPEIRPAHLLLALLTQNDGIAAPLLEAVGVEPATVRAETQRLIDTAQLLVALGSGWWNTPPSELAPTPDPHALVPGSPTSTAAPPETVPPDSGPFWERWFK